MKDNFVIYVIGDGATGRGTTISKIMEKWKECNKDGVIYLWDEQGSSSRFSNLSNFLIPNKPNWKQLILDQWSKERPNSPKSLTVLKHFKHIHHDHNIEELFITKRSRNADYILICRSPKDYNFRLLADCTNFAIFYREDLRDRFYKRQTPYFWLYNAVSSFLKKYVKKNGRGKHPLDPEYDGYGFPYCMVDVRSLTIALGMDESKIKEKWITQLQKTISLRCKIDLQIKYQK